MADSEFTIPDENLPEGFAESVDTIPEHPAVPRPAATVVLARDGRRGMEVLLVRRHRASGFVPGAWVFPGGRIDDSDADPGLADRAGGLSPDQAAERLGIHDGATPAFAYYLGSVRETFEETGLFLGWGSNREPVAAAADDPDVDQARIDLLEERLPFLDLLKQLDWTVDLRRMEYLAHWITPVAEPRRYDTRFFLAEVAGESRVRLDAREMIAEQWLAPAEALGAWKAGQLPMVFPTIKTLQSLTPFERVGHALAHYGTREIPSILPRLVRTPTGVGIEIPE